MNCLFSHTGGEESFPRLPLVLSRSRNLPCSTVLWTLSCSDSMDQTQQIDLAKGTLPWGCLKYGVGCGVLSKALGSRSALVLRSGCCDFLFHQMAGGNYCLVSVDLCTRSENAKALLNLLIKRQVSVEGDLMANSPANAHSEHSGHSRDLWFSFAAPTLTHRVLRSCRWQCFHLSTRSHSWVGVKAAYP